MSNLTPKEILATHDLYETGDKNVPSSICDSNGEVALGLCKRCGRGEIELEEPCDIGGHPHV